jgi:hypothetical protein
MEAPGGGIMGVYSLAERRPVKSGGFSREDESFADAVSYGDWKFFYTPPNTQDAQGDPNAPSAAHTPNVQGAPNAAGLPNAPAAPNAPNSPASAPNVPVAR